MKKAGKTLCNDLYEYLYRIETGRHFDGDNGTKGIPSEEFELLLQKYLPFSKRQIRVRADRSEDGTRYLWEPLRCGNLIPQSMPVPEVIGAEHKRDGRIVLTVDAVLKQKGTDCLFRHKVTLKNLGTAGCVILGIRSEQQIKREFWITRKGTDKATRR